MVVDIKDYAIPETAGVYIFKDEDGKILYVGKSSNLKERIKTYFQQPNKMEPRIACMVRKVADIEYITCNNELEATFKEASLIRDLQPQYNIALKDNKSFPLLVIVKSDDFPYVTIKRETDFQKIKIRKSRYSKVITTLPPSDAESESGNTIEYFGPLKSSKIIKNSIQLIQSIFKFRTCSLSIFEKDKNRKYFKPCLLYYIKMCSAPCANKISKDEYNEDINQLRKFLNGENSSLIKDLETKMKLYAKNQEYEKAANLRDKIYALKTISESERTLYYHTNTFDIAKLNPAKSLQDLKEKFKLPKIPKIIDGVDISNIKGQYATGSIVRFKNGYPDKSGYRRYKIKTVEGTNDIAMMKEVIIRRFTRLINEEDELPDILLLDGGIGHFNEVEKVFEELKVEVFLIALAKYEKDHIYIKLKTQDPKSPQVNKTVKSQKLDPKESYTQLLTFIRDEAHRFAKTYHQVLRRKSIF